jgi:predicted nucleic acid-binding protein
VTNDRAPPALEHGERLADFGDRLLGCFGVDDDDVGRVADCEPIILQIAADNSAGERHIRAADLIARSIRRGNCVQTLQSLSEFFSVVTRKAGVPAAAAAAFVEGWAAVMPVEASTTADLRDAIRAVRDDHLAFWDAISLATIRRIGVQILITEDFQDGRTLDGVRFVDPFVDANAKYVDRVLPPA